MAELTLKLKERTLLYKNFVTWAKAKRIDVAFTTFLGWLEIQEYLNVEKIREDLEKEKEKIDEHEQI